MKTAIDKYKRRIQIYKYIIKEEYKYINIYITSNRNKYIRL